MATSKELSLMEVRRTVATSLAAAFGFVIALLWNQVVQGGLFVAGVSTTAPGDLVGWLAFVGTAGILTAVMVVLIVLVGRWGGKV